MTHARSAGRLLGRRLLAALAAGAALVTVAAPAALGSQRPAPSLVRLTHLAPDMGGVDITLTRFESSEGLTVDDVTYGEVSEYRPIAPGFYSVAVMPADQPDAASLLTASLEVSQGAAATVAVTGVGGGHAATVLTDDLTPPPAGQARVRLLQGASSAPTVDVAAVDGPVIAEDVAFGAATGYANVPAGTWTIRITPAGGASPATTEVTLPAGSVQTLLILDEGPAVAARTVPDQSPSGGSGVAARVVTDGEGMAQMPSGGVQAGAGSTASPDSRSAGATLTVLALAGAAGLGVTVGLLRRPATDRAASGARHGGL